LIQVRHDDPFNLTNLVVNSTLEVEKAEIYSNHNYIQEFSVDCGKDVAKRETFATLCLRSVPNKGTKEYFRMIMTDKLTSKKRKKKAQLKEG
jgi:hypothetical protein